MTDEARVRIVVRERTDRQIVIDPDLFEYLGESRREAIETMIGEVAGRLISKATRQRRAHEAIVIDISIGLGREAD